MPFDVWRLDVLVWSEFASGHVLHPPSLGVGVTNRRGGEATGRAQLINFPLSPRLEMQRMTQIRDRLPSLLVWWAGLCNNSLCRTDNANVISGIMLCCVPVM